MRDNNNVIGNYLCRDAELRDWAGDESLLCAFCKNKSRCEQIKQIIKFYQIGGEINEKAAA